MSSCKNCGTKLSGNFCAECGQRATEKEIDWRFVWNDIRFLFFSYDSSIFLTIHGLLLMPGEFIREYIAGKRVKRFSPVRLTLTLAGLYVAAVFTFKINLVSVNESPKASEIPFHLVANWILSHYALVELSLVPLLALSSFLSFSRNSFAVHFALSAFLASQHILIKLIFLLIALFIDKSSKLLLSTLPSFLTLVMFTFTYYQLFQSVNKRERILRILALYAAFALLFLGLLAAGLEIYKYSNK